MSDDRLITLERGHNFRDFGGYATSDGRRVRRGVLYRSGAMADLTEADTARLDALGIARICDLRANGERQRFPTRWHDEARVRTWSRDYEHSAGSLSSFTAGGGEAVRQRMIALYRVLADEQRDAYAALFGHLLAGDLPLLVNCSAGKDRTGLAAALVLSALGVPRASVIEDYVFSDRFAEPLFALLSRDADYALTPASPRDAWLPMARALPEYIEASFAAFDGEYGGVEAYLDQVLGVDAGALERLRGLLLE